MAVGVGASCGCTGSGSASAVSTGSTGFNSSGVSVAIGCTTEVSAGTFEVSTSGSAAVTVSGETRVTSCIGGTASAWVGCTVSGGTSVGWTSDGLDSLRLHRFGDHFFRLRLDLQIRIAGRGLVGFGIAKDDDAHGLARFLLRVVWRHDEADCQGCEANGVKGKGRQAGSGDASLARLRLACLLFKGTMVHRRRVCRGYLLRLRMFRERFDQREARIVDHGFCGGLALRIAQSGIS